jgi:hypothetical protein
VKEWGSEGTKARATRLPYSSEASTRRGAEFIEHSDHLRRKGELEQTGR